MNPMTGREAQIEKRFLKHTPSNPTKHVEYPERQIRLQVSNTSQSYSAVKWGDSFYNQNWMEFKARGLLKPESLQGFLLLRKVSK